MNKLHKRRTKIKHVTPKVAKGSKRNHWLARVIRERGYTIGAEVGCQTGTTSAYVLRRCRGLHLYCVDLWAPVPKEAGGGMQYRHWNFPSIYKRFQEKTSQFRDQMTILQGLSWEMAGRVKDNSLDFVFIDASHEYESVVKDIIAWNPKLKPGGMMCGHDINGEGVKRAVNELISDYKVVGVDRVWEARKEDVIYGQGVKRIVDGFVVPNPVEDGIRYEWLAQVIKECGYTIGAEIGCQSGNTSVYILQNCEELHLYCVDLWDHTPEGISCSPQYRNWNFPSIERKFKKKTEAFHDRMTVLKGLSWEMAGCVEDNSLDFVFIDADHEYESVVKDIKVWNPKLKQGTMLCGHDIHFEGVKRAVDELIPNWEAVGIDHVWKCKKEDVKING